MKNKILAIILTLVICFSLDKIIAATYVETVQLNESNYIKPAMYITKTGHNGRRTFAQVRFLRKADGTPVYCVEPFVKVATGVDYNGYVDDVSEFIQNATYTDEPFTMEQWRRATLIANYGYGYGNHTEEKWYAVAQMMIWKAVYNNIVIGFSSSFSNSQNGIIDYSIGSAEEQEINNLINSHDIVPSFNISGNLVVGQTVSFNDANGVLDKFAILSTNNCTASKSGNTLYITPTGVGNINVELCKGDPNARPPTLYVKPSAQNVMMAGSVPVYSNVSANAVGGRITINKVDAQTTNIQGDATFEGAIYGVYDNVGTEVSRVTLGINGSAITDYLAPGVYTIREVQASRGYNLSNEAYTVNLTTDNLNPVQQVSENVIKGGIVIFKKLDATEYDEEINLSGVQFKVTLKSDPSKVYYTNVSEEDGICRVDDIPYGTYEVEESIVPDEAIKIANFDVKISENGKIYEYTKMNLSKKIKIKIIKEDIDKKENDPNDYTQGDAKLEGAEYEIYRNEACTDLVTTIVVDHKDENGYWCAQTGTLRTATYYAKEKKAPVGYLKDDKIYKFEGINTEQEIEIEIKEETSRETVQRGSLKIVKYDNINISGTDKSPAEGAILRLSLDSNKEKYYEVEISNVGYAEFIEEEVRNKYYPYTIPYGEYTLTEIKGSNSGAHTHYFSHPEPVKIVKQDQREYRILEEEPVQMYLTLQKIDKDTNQKVSLPGGMFKVWDCQKNTWVINGGKDEFETGEDGSITLPEKLNAGEYIIYETKAPDGYYIQEELRLPENESDLGNKEKYGKYVNIDKAAMGVEDNATGPVKDLYYIVDMPNEPLKGKIEILKQGEMLTDVTAEQTSYGDKYTPKYENRGLKGVKYEIYAVGDINSPDGSYTYVSDGTLVDTIVTKEDGIATTKDLYLGEYRIVEVEASTGFLIDSNIENITITNDNPYNKVQVNNINLNNVRQKLFININKRYEDVKFSDSNVLEPNSIFGVYTNQDIMSSEGNLLVSKDSLLDIVNVNSVDSSVNTNIDLPIGEYYVKELYTSYPYEVIDEKIPVKLEYKNNSEENIVEVLHEIVNDHPYADLSLIKISSSSMNEIILEGNKLNTSMLEEKEKEIINSINQMTDEEVRLYFEQQKVKYISGAVFGIYLDSECTKSLYIRDDEKDEYVEARLETDDMGIASIERIPIGKYYVKELETPAVYDKKDEIVEIELTAEDQSNRIYKLMVNDSIIENTIKKIDIFDSEPVPNCLVELRDDENNVILTLRTDENGDGYIPLDLIEDGRKYSYVELDAPDIYKKDGKLYELNTTPKEFIAKYTTDENGKVVFESKVQMENYRTRANVELQKSDFLEGTPIPNCKFELKSLESDFVVEGVTDKDGIYVFENIPYGEYTYTELEAPSEYMIDTTPHKITIDIEQVKIDVKNEKNLNTGDIAILTISVIAIISIIGIIFVVIRSKNNKE